MYLKSILISLLLLGLSAIPGVVTKEKIQMLCPMVGEKAGEFALIIDRYAHLHGLNVDIIVAIFKQESECGQYLTNGCEKVHAKIGNVWKEVETCKDYGFYQVNYRNVRGEELDVNALMTDFDYATRWTVLRLKKIKDMYKKIDSIWYCRYHSHSPKIKYEYCGYLYKHLAKLRGEEGF